MKELLFSVTAKDCRWDYYRGSGAGGQKRNKTDSAVRCTHMASGAVGQAEDERSQHQNKRLAFARMGRSERFQKWARIEACRVTGKLAEIEEWLDREMEMNIRVEKKDDEGRWVEWIGT
jgi:hypothetical protein